jgi:limonene-1,2-epoxide hydrolase
MLARTGEAHGARARRDSEEEPMSADNERLIRDFCAAWSRRDIDELLAFFAEDAVYHNMPLAPAQGRAAIRQVMEFFVPPAQAIVFELRAIASVGTVVFTERLDRFVIGGKSVELPVAGVFEVEAGKIRAWRDYFDMATWTRQTA